MKNFIFPVCAILLLTTSCKSTKNLFQKNELQQNITIEQNEPESMPVATEGKKSFVYHSVDKTVKLPTNFDVTKTIADLQVLPDRIEYSCSYNGNDDEGGRKAAVSNAIFQALRINGNADVLVEPKYEIQTENGHIISVKVSGYVANYCNFRTATQEDLKLLKEGNNKTQVVSKTPQQDKPEK